MGLAIKRVNELPLGRRTLRLGDWGNDVRALQESLKEAGFYFGQTDGIFGLLTMEAVLFWQKTFDVKVDGIAGPEMIRALRKGPGRTGRIILTVRAHETLSGLSQRYGVSDTAWDSLPGQGNPQKRIYPGMKLVLPEKMLLVWENELDALGRFTVSGIVSPGWQLTLDGEFRETQKREPGIIYLIQAETAVWEAVMGNRKHWEKIATQIKGLELARIGLDLRNAPLQTIARWRNFIKYCTAKSRQKFIGLLILPLVDRETGVNHGIFWIHLPAIAAHARYIMLEPEHDYGSPEESERVFQRLPRVFRKLSQAGIITKTLLSVKVGGVLWSRGSPEETWVRRNVPFREAKMLQAMFFKSAKVLPYTKLTKVEFSSRQQVNMLIYRNLDGWSDLAQRIARSNMAGLVIRNFSDLKDVGPRVVSGAFAVAQLKI